MVDDSLLLAYPGFTSTPRSACAPATALPAILVLSAVLAVGAPARGQDYSPEEAEILAAIWEADLGPERVYVDEGHYYCLGTHCTAQYLTAVNACFQSEEGCTGFSSPYSCLGGGSAGPKGSAIRDWVITNTP